MRVLFVAPYLPTPGSGGRTRLINIMARLAERHEVELVAFPARDQLDAASPYPGEVVELPPLRSRPGGFRGTVQFYRERFERFPAFASGLTSPAMRDAVREAVERFRPQVVQVETTEMAQYLAAIPSEPLRALDLQDVASRWFARVARLGRGKSKLMLSWELFRARRYDMRHARMADVVFVTSEAERASLRSLSGVDPVEVPNGVDTSLFVPLPEIPEIDGRVVFVGPMSYVANLEGMKWFAKEVFPRIRAVERDVVVDLVGDPEPNPGWPAGFEVHGRVEDVRPFIARAPVSIVPVTFGSGTRYKILEALSMERAVVSTSVGAEGLGLVHDRHVLLADDPEPFADAVLALLREPARRSALGAAGAAHVRAHFDWGPLVERIERAWEAGLQVRRASTT